MKTNFRNFASYFFLEHLSLYILLMIIQKQTVLFEFYKISTFEDLFYFVYLFGAMPTLSFILFSIPLYNIFRIENKLLFTISLSSVFIVESLLYSYLASPGNYNYGFYKMIFGISIMTIMFYKSTPFYRIKENK